MGPMFKQIEATEITIILSQLESQKFNEPELKAHFLNLKSKITLLFIEIEKVI
jgi:hypothetical protein